MERYSHDIMANNLDKDFWNGYNHYLLCPNYNGVYCALGMELYSRPLDDFYLIYETSDDTTKIVKSSVSVNFAPNSFLWEGAYTMLQAILASDKQIAKDIMRAIKLNETKSFNVDLKAIIEPDEMDLADYDPNEVSEYYGTYVLTINPVVETINDDETHGTFVLTIDPIINKTVNNTNEEEN